MTARVPAPRRGGRAGTRAGVWFAAPFTLLFLVFFVLPIAYAAWQSLFTERHGALGLGPATTVFSGLDNYTRALDDAAFTEGLVRVLLFTAVQVPLMTGLAAVLALLLDQVPRWERLLRTSYFLPYGVPGVVASLLWGFLYVPGLSPIVDLLDTAGLPSDLLGGDAVLWSVLNIVVWEFAGYNTLVVVAALKAVPSELYEAARIDGAGPWRTAWHIKLPLIRPALGLISVFSIIGGLQLFNEPLVLRQVSSAITNAWTPNTAAYTQAFDANNYHLAAAQSVILAGVAALAAGIFLAVLSYRDRRVGR